MRQDQDGISFPNGLGWSSSLAYGAELRIAGIGASTAVAEIQVARIDPVDLVFFLLIFF